MAKKSERPVGVPAARGHGGDGGADIRGRVSAPEYSAIMPVVSGSVDSPTGSIRPGTNVPH